MESMRKILETVRTTPSAGDEPLLLRPPCPPCCDLEDSPYVDQRDRSARQHGAAAIWGWVGNVSRQTGDLLP